MRREDVSGAVAIGGAWGEHPSNAHGGCKWSSKGGLGGEHPSNAQGEYKT